MQPACTLEPSAEIVRGACDGGVCAPVRLQGVIAVDALHLGQRSPGIYQLHCLLVRLRGSDGAPVRCVTMG